MANRSGRGGRTRRTPGRHRPAGRGSEELNLTSRERAIVDAWLVRTTDPLIDFSTRLDIEEGIVDLLAGARGWVLPEFLAQVLERLVDVLDHTDPWFTWLLHAAVSDAHGDDSVDHPDHDDVTSSPWLPAATVDAGRALAAACEHRLAGRSWADLYCSSDDPRSAAVLAFGAIDRAIRVAVAHAWTSESDVNPTIVGVLAAQVDSGRR